MNRNVLIATMLIGSVSAMAQTEVTDSLTLAEVTVTAAEVIKNPDGMTILPTALQKESSEDIYRLLGQLSLPELRIDPVVKSIVPLADVGKVQVRIDGKRATQNELMALEMAAIASIEYIQRPGVRYGSEVGRVIDIHTKRPTSGYALGASALQALTWGYGYGNAYAKVNFGKNEIDLGYWGDYSNANGSRMSETSDYALSDGSTAHFFRQELSHHSTSHDHDLQLRWSRGDAGHYLLQTALLTSWSKSPTDRRSINVNGDDYSICQTQFSAAPALNIYGVKYLPRNQTLTADITGTFIDSDYRLRNDEPGTTDYDSEGKSYSLWADLTYEKKWEAVTFAAGSEYVQKYVSNLYKGGLAQRVGERNSSLYLFAQAKGEWKRLSYGAGLGLSRIYYRQNEVSTERWLVRSNVYLSCDLGSGFSMSYNFDMRQKPPRIAKLSGIAIRRNAMDIEQGNPELKTSRVTEQSFSVAYSRPRFYNSLSVHYRTTDHACLQDIHRTADDLFLYTYGDDTDCNIFYLMDNVRWTLLPERLELSAWAMMLRCFNYGLDYEHFRTAWTCGGTLSAYLGAWTLQLTADTGSKVFEGETRIDNGGAYYFYASYRWKKCTFGFLAQHFFDSRVHDYSSRLENRLVHKTYDLFDSDRARMFALNVSWRFSAGRSYESARGGKIRSDDESGIVH